MAGNARASDEGSNQAAEAGRPEAPAIAEPRVTALGHAEPRAGEPGHPSSGAKAAPHPAQQMADAPKAAPPLGRNPEVHDAALPPHEPGSMDISAHERTYEGFIRWTIRVVAVILAVLIMLAIFNA